MAQPNRQPDDADTPDDWDAELEDHIRDDERHEFDEERNREESDWDHETSDNVAEHDRDHPSSSEAHSAWAVSLCFWLTLTVAGVLYGAVALSPKLSVWMTARNEFIQNSQQLSALENKVDYLERVCQTLDTDPDFLQRMSQASGAAVHVSDGHELIPVSGDLLFGYEDPTTVAEITSQPGRFDQLIRIIGRRRRLRTALLVTASLLTLFGFTFLNDAGTQLVDSFGRAIRWGATVPIRRYVHPIEDDSSDAEEC